VNDAYRIIGAEMSPYSVKVRSYFRVTLGDHVWTQKPQKYHARSLGMLRAKYAAIADKTALDPILAAAGCLEGLRG
jgi:hypothetical protein